jgi:hypothetical protein
MRFFDEGLIEGFFDGGWIDWWGTRKNDAAGGQLKIRGNMG